MCSSGLLGPWLVYITAEMGASLTLQALPLHDSASETEEGSNGDIRASLLVPLMDGIKEAEVKDLGKGDHWKGADLGFIIDYVL